MRLPTRYEDLDPAFRARLRADRQLLSIVQGALKSMERSGGIRFLPIFGRSGSGKSSAARELSTHLPGVKVVELSRSAIASEADLLQEIRAAQGRRNQPKLIVAVVDQFEEKVAEQTALPSQFVERLSLLDRGALRTDPVLFLWLTTSRDFQRDLARATSRNERILVRPDWELQGPPRSNWSDIVEETFAFHNGGQPLADFEVLRGDIDDLGDSADTIGQLIEQVGQRLDRYTTELQDLSRYQVVMLWPVTDGQRIARIAGFTSPRDGYKLDWNAFYRELNELDRQTLPLSELNRARLYFDVRLVPIAAADLRPLCRHLDAAEIDLPASYLGRLSKAHLVSVISERWDPSTYAPMRERESERATEARMWYPTVTGQPTLLGRRIALALRQLGFDAKHEQDVTSPFATVRADILVQRPGSQQDKVIVELKAFSPENTMPSAIKDAIRTTLKRHATFGGFLGRQ
jgi:adenylate kinase family enzyme